MMSYPFFFGAIEPIPNIYSGVAAIMFPHFFLNQLIFDETLVMNPVIYYVTQLFGIMVLVFTGMMYSIFIVYYDKVPKKLISAIHLVTGLGDILTCIIALQYFPHIGALIAFAWSIVLVIARICHYRSYSVICEKQM